MYTTFIRIPVDRFFIFESGPFHIKSGTKVENRYAVIFICLTTGAFHVIIAHSGKMAVSRRGQVTLIWSDNGTNLQGSSRELLEYVLWLVTRNTHTLPCCCSAKAGLHVFFPHITQISIVENIFLNDIFN